jgi:uncharacterized protein YjbI with pentapeptide repeats
MFKTSLPYTLIIVAALTLNSSRATLAHSNSPPAGQDSIVSSGNQGPVTSSRTVSAASILAAMQEEGLALDYSGQTIEGDLDLTKLPITRNADDSGDERVVKRELNFTKATFTGSIFTTDQQSKIPWRDQARVRFAKNVNWHDAQFLESVSLQNVDFDGLAGFNSARFHRMASFMGSAFKERALFRSAEFTERALFSEAKFFGETDFTVATFHWFAFFLKARFPKGFGGGNFLRTRFNGEAIFSGATFEGLARFVGTRFQGLGSFSDATFNDQVHFAGGTRFDDVASFRRAKFIRADLIPYPGTTPRPPVVFGGVIFAGDAHFAQAEFNHVSFAPLEGLEVEQGTDTVFRQKADFRGVTCSSIDLRRVSFGTALDLTGATLGTRPHLTEIDLSQADMNLKWEQLVENGRPKFVWQNVFEDGQLKRRNATDTESVQSRRDETKFFAFLATLEEKFTKAGQLSDAAEVSYLASDLRRRQRSSIGQVTDTILLKWIYGYGVSPWNQVVLSFLIIVIFSFFYRKPGVIKPSSQPIRLRIAEIPIDSSPAPHTSIDSSETKQSRIRRYLRGLWFSAAVFLKIGFGNLWADRRYAALVVTEWIIGLFVWALFLVNLSNRWPLLHRLVVLAT